MFSGDQDIHKHRLEEILGFSLDFDINKLKNLFITFGYLRLKTFNQVIFYIDMNDRIYDKYFNVMFVAPVLQPLRSGSQDFAVQQNTCNWRVLVL